MEITNSLSPTFNFFSESFLFFKKKKITVIWKKIYKKKKNSLRMFDVMLYHATVQKMLFQDFILTLKTVAVIILRTRLGFYLN